MSDNGPKFVSKEFYIRVAPYHPASNGEAERFVQTFKNSLKANKDDVGTKFYPFCCSI